MQGIKAIGFERRTAREHTVTPLSTSSCRSRDLACADAGMFIAGEESWPLTCGWYMDQDQGARRAHVVSVHRLRRVGDSRDRRCLGTDASRCYHRRPARKPLVQQRSYVAQTLYAQPVPDANRGERTQGPKYRTGDIPAGRASPLPRSGGGSTSTGGRSRNSDTRPATGKARVPPPTSFPRQICNTRGAHGPACTKPWRPRNCPA